jgi:hypothetical protein
MCSDLIEQNYVQNLQTWDKDMIIRGSEDFEYSI